MLAYLILAVTFGLGFASGYGVRDLISRRRRHRNRRGGVSPRPAPETGEGGETLDLVRVGADGSPHWTHGWPTPEENPRHARLELWIAVYGYRIVSRPASAFDWCEDEGRS